MERKNKKKIKWDIKNIQSHNKLRGTRIKISEGKTPKKPKSLLNYSAFQN